MELNIVCPECYRGGYVEPNLLWQQVRCPHCGEEIIARPATSLTEALLAEVLASQRVQARVTARIWWLTAVGVVLLAGILTSWVVAVVGLTLIGVSSLFVRSGR